MGFLDSLLGRSKQAAPNLDHLFGLPGARITLQAAEGIAPTGHAGVCFKPTVGQEFKATQSEFADLLKLDTDAASTTKIQIGDKVDEYGYQWVVVDDSDFDSLVSRVHLVNSTLEEHGFGAQLLCSVFGFAASESADSLNMASAEASMYLVYLYKRGTFYPFIPQAGEKRDNEGELRLKAELGQDLRIEPELDRWFPIWKLPVQ